MFVISTSQVETIQAAIASAIPLSAKLRGTEHRRRLFQFAISLEEGLQKLIGWRIATGVDKMPASV